MSSPMAFPSSSEADPQEQDQEMEDVETPTRQNQNRRPLFFSPSPNKGEGSQSGSAAVAQRALGIAGTPKRPLAGSGQNFTTQVAASSLFLQPISFH